VSELTRKDYLQPLLAILFGALLLAQASKAQTSVDQLADPTRPAQFRDLQSADSYRLESVINSRQRRVAIINGKALAVGETLGDATVQAIGVDSVQLQLGNKIIPLKLSRLTVKKEVSKR
jgi:hypothetical protein